MSVLPSAASYAFIGACTGRASAKLRKVVPLLERIVRVFTTFIAAILLWFTQLTSSNVFSPLCRVESNSAYRYLRQRQRNLESAARLAPGTITLVLEIKHLSKTNIQTVTEVLAQLSQNFDLVLWTILPKAQAEEIIAKLGIEKYFRLVLTREDSLEDCEGPLKDYSALADEPHKVIFIDEDAAPYVLNPGNLIQLPAGYPIEKLPGRLQDLSLIHI
eukprot:TRINITY_DN9419_c0_g1_i21.p1 TRINITY_DN9419_c0_g1~~TRINITY_DN9419_c0_g1_i21.p1  ORF type:complete len:217 (-),score=31.03 TRINITY_DN9419_c0_g1_i21:61-711(-)